MLFCVIKNTLLTRQFEAAAPIETSLCDGELILVTCCPLIVSNF